MTMRSSSKRKRRKTQREATHEKRQGDAVFEEEESEIVFRNAESPAGCASPVPRSPMVSPVGSTDLHYEDVLDMVQKLQKEQGLITLDYDKIRTVCSQLLKDNQARDQAIGNLTGLVQRSLSHRPDNAPPHHIIQLDLIDNEGNLRAEDIGITWEGSDTFLHGVRVVASDAANMPARRRLSTSTPYQPVREHAPCDMSTPRQPLGRPPVCLEVPDAPSHHQEGRQSYRPAAPIQRFNNKSLNWPAWFSHFRAVADVHGWDKCQRALQLVSYMNETAMNVAQELGDDELYDYDILVKLLGDRFDPASRVSASRSRFHGRSRRHHEDADSFADAITKLCRLGYPHSSPELRQKLISEQFVRGQLDPELKNVCVVIRTQKDRKLQTLIERASLCSQKTLASSLAELWWTRPVGGFRYWCQTLVKTRLWWSRFRRWAWLHRCQLYKLLQRTSTGLHTTLNHFRFTSAISWIRRLEIWVRINKTNWRVSFSDMQTYFLSRDRR